VHHSYFVRATAVEAVVRRWAAATAPPVARPGSPTGPRPPQPRRRVVVLGAGLDTLPLRLLRAWRPRPSGDGVEQGSGQHSDVDFIEVRCADSERGGGLTSQPNLSLLPNPV
jgi:hypothetical protein